MKHLFFLCAALLLFRSAQAELREETLEFGAFGTIHLCQTADTPEHVVLLLSGDEGWDAHAVQVARIFAENGPLVAGIDSRNYLTELEKIQGECSHPAAHLESLHHYLQSKYALQSSNPPILAGSGAGAGLVYATLAQAPPGSIMGGISIGFCPQLQLKKPLCQGNGPLTLRIEPDTAERYSFNPVELSAPWLVLQPEGTCREAAIRPYVDKAGKGRLTMLAGAGSDGSQAEGLRTQISSAYRALIQSGDHPAQSAAVSIPDSLADLPLTVLPVSGKGQNYFAVIVTGDGGWAAIDQALGASFTSNGIGVVGLNALKYYWSYKSPEQSAADLARIISHYRLAWRKKQVVLVGYSRGADVLPFMINRLPGELQKQIVASALLGAESEIEFQFKVSDWLSAGKTDTSFPVLPEVKKLAGMHLACIYGADEQTKSICPKLDGKSYTVVRLKGGHHFDGDYQQLAKRILDHFTASASP